MPTSPDDGQDARFRRLVEHLGAGVAVVDASGRFLAANPVFCRTVGYRPDELVAMDFLSLTHPEDRPRNLRLVEELLAGQRDSFVIEKRYLTKARGPVWVRVTVTVMHDGQQGAQLVATTEDISAQKDLEARFVDSQALLRIAGEVGRVGGWAIDADPLRVHWSDEVYALTGHPRDRQPPFDEALHLYPSGDRERMAAAVEACLIDGVPFDLTCRLLPAQGEPLWVRVVGQPRWTAGGTVERIQGAIIDISEQHRAQQETELLAERLRTTMESITDAVFVLDTDWRFTFLNQRAQELLERDAEGLIGGNIWEQFPDTVGTELQTAYERAVADDCTVVIDEYHYPPLGRSFDVHAYPSSQGLTVYFQDVTAKRAARIELEERGVRLAQQAALLDGAQGAIAVTDLHGRISYWNHSAERIYGWSADEAIGRRMDELLRIDPARFAEATESLLVAGIWSGEATKTAKDGRERMTATRLTLVRDDQGRPASVLGIDTDITERKRIERQFLRAQRLESIGKLAGGIAHDLNNALAPIALATELLQDAERDPTRQRMLEIIADSANHGTKLVGQVLEFARGVDGRREPLAVGGVVEKVARISADTFPSAITLETHVFEGLWPVIGDATQIEQVLINLCLNARDAMPDGGTLTIAATNSCPKRVGTLPDTIAPYIRLRVSDTGEGMREDVLRQMFDPFFSTKPHGQGTGLGLPTSMVIVESHGGHIEVDSRVGAGTAVTVILPADPRTARCSSSGPAAPW